MTKEEYGNEIRRVVRARKFRKNPLPKSVWNYGFELCRNKSQSWLVNRVIFWLYAYDKNHKWTEKDFLYEVNDAAYEKAKAKRAERKREAREYALKKHNKPRPAPRVDTSWEGCSGPPLDLIKERIHGDSK